MNGHAGYMGAARWVSFNHHGEPESGEATDGTKPAKAPLAAPEIPRSIGASPSTTPTCPKKRNKTE